VHAEERGHGRVDAGQFHGHHAVEQVAAARAAVPLVGQPDDPQPADGGDELVRELLTRPVPVDDRLDLLLHELPDLLQLLPAGRVEQQLE
jgi:hypothetical protein